MQKGGNNFLFPNSLQIVLNEKYLLFNYEKPLQKKIKIAKQIYKLITTICKDNPENEKYTYNLKDNFLF